MNDIPAILRSLPPAQTDAEWLEVAKSIHDMGIVELKRAVEIDSILDAHHKLQAVEEYIMLVLRDRDTKLHAANEITDLRLRQERWMGNQLSGPDFQPSGRPEKTLDASGVFKKTLKSVGIDYSQAHRWKTIADIPQPMFECYLLENSVDGKELSSNGLIRLAKQLKQQDHLDTLRSADSQTCTSSDLNEIISRGMTFGTIYADPPWSYGNQATRASTDNHYPTLTPEQIARDFAPQIRALSAPNAHLHLWTTNAFLFDSKAILEAWGFEYKSMFIWVKPQIGMGNYWRLAHEFLLLGIKGNCPFADRSIRSWLETPRGDHSDKPDEIRSLIEKVSPPAYFELFGRRPVHNWVVYGNEIDQGLFYQSVENSSTHTPKVPTIERDSVTQLRLVQ